MVKNRREPEDINKFAGLGVRHLQTLLVFLCLTCAYALRVNLSVAIVAMVDKDSSYEHFDWDPLEQSTILSSFFWGYVTTQILAGQLAERFGAKFMLLFSIGICSILNLLTPVAASGLGWYGMIVLRILQGCCQGFIFPSTHALLSKWAPISERAKLGTFCYSGSQFGTVVMLSISGVLADSFGWPSVFYISGGVSLLWTILWFFIGSSSPNDYKSISPEEKLFIQSSTGRIEHETHPKTPWKAIFTSTGVYMLIIVHCAHNWGFWTLLTEIPSYMKYALKLDIKNSALYSALPYFMMWLLSIILSVVQEKLIKYGMLTVPVSRRLFNTIGLWGPMCALIGLGYVAEGQITLAVALLTIAVGINAGTYLGFQVNHIDMAPNYAGTLMGITNCAANIMSIIAPLLVGFIVTDNTNPEQWRIVFFISASIYFIGNLLFIIFGKFEIQPWNEPKYNSKDNNIENGTNTSPRND